MTTAGLSEMEGFSAGRMGADEEADLAAEAAGAVCACTVAPGQSPKNTKTLIRNNLKDDRIVHLGIFFRHRRRNIDFQTVNQSWSNAGLALEELRSGLQGNAVK